MWVATAPAHALDLSLYVDRTMSSCSDTGAGTASAPYCTIARAMAQLQPGTTVYIGNGSYAETIKPAVSGTDSAPVMVTSWPGRQPVIGTGVLNGASLVNRSYVTIAQVQITGTTGAGIAVSGGTHVSVVDNEVTRAGQPVSGKVAQGITLSGTSAGLVRGNNTHDNSSHGIMLTGGTTGTTVAGNVSSGNAEGYRRNANGIDVVSPGNSILGNVTHDNEDSGINVYPGGNDTLVAGNVSYDNGDHGIDNLNVTGGRLIGNTIYRNCTSGINVEGTSGNYVVENNVAVDNAVYPAYKGISCSRRAGDIGIWDSAPSSTTVDHNLVYLTRTDKPMYVFGSSYSSLAAMKAATGQEQHGVEGSPRFTDAAAWDLSLTSGSPAIDRGNSGVSGAQPTDILGNPRVDDPGTPNTQAEGPRRYDDLGAYEFQGSSGVQAQAPTARLTVTPTSGSAPLAVTADASASSDPQGQPLSYAFDFGDGTGTGQQASATSSHTYGVAGTYALAVTVTNTAGLSATSSQTVTVTSASVSQPSFVGTIANNYSTSTHTSGYLTVYKSAGVRAGDLVVLTLQLSGTATSGAVSGTDAAGSSYGTVASVSDGGGNRLVVLAGVARGALVANDKITVTFPSAATYRLSGDEFAGSTSADQAATATGTSSAYSSGAVQAGAGSMVFGAVSVPVGSANPTWSGGWTQIGSYSVSSRYLSKAYQLPAAGSYAATGTASGPWLAAAVSFRP